MGKGAVDDRSHLSLMAVGLQARDHVLTGFDRADLVISVGYDLVEYAPSRWNPDGTKRILHIDTQPAEVDAAYQPEVELVGDIDGALERLLEAALPGGVGGRSATQRHESRETLVHADLRTSLLADLTACETDAGYPIKPQRALYELRRALGPEDIVVSDVGAHKIWIARLYQAYEPNTVVISNGFAAMGISLPGAIAAKLVHPDRKVVALCGDGGFLMNAQELETAKRIGAAVVVIVWRDDGYGLIDWKQRNEFGRPFAVEFGNPDIVDFARSFGIAGFRPESADDLYPTLMRALELGEPAVIDVPIDYRENVRLTERLGALSGLLTVAARRAFVALVAACQSSPPASPAASRDPTLRVPTPSGARNVRAGQGPRRLSLRTHPASSPIASRTNERHVGAGSRWTATVRRRERTTPGRSPTDGRTAYLFGGRDGGTVFDDLWSFDLATERWQRELVDGPPAARFGHEAAWLPGRGPRRSGPGRPAPTSSMTSGCSTRRARRGSS